MSAFIVLAIGSPQRYISQARRTHDLWQGSRILSYLAEVGVQRAAQEGQAEVIYPVLVKADPDRDPRDRPANIPNRIVVCWHGDPEGARQCAEGMQAAIEQAWKDISGNTFTYFVENNELSHAAIVSIEAIWRRQEKAWLECYWVVVPEDPDQTYAENIQQANGALGARKLTRNFPQIRERGVKCTITGEHEILHDDRPMAEWVDLWDHVRKQQRNRALIGANERLSAISTIKRMAHEPKNNPLALQLGERRFPSTSSMAAAPFKHDVLLALDAGPQPDLQAALNAFLRALEDHFDNPQDLYFNRDGQFNPEYFGLINRTVSPETLRDKAVVRLLSLDGDFLFDDTLIPKTIAEYSGRKEPTQREMRPVQDALKELFKATDTLGIARPQPYLVILSMDGDHMGCILGDLLDADQHYRFSETLARFAHTEVMRIVEQEYLGRVVYAGGDDVLALLPVRGALDTAEKLRAKFAEVIDKAKILDFEGNVIAAHVSTGLAYVHHTHNLQDAVRAAQDTQKTVAKGAYGRNALAVRLLKRSGESRTMGRTWEISGHNTVYCVTTLALAFAEGYLARNLPYDLSQMVYSMTGPQVPFDARKAELTRIVKRRMMKKPDERILDLIMALVGEPAQPKSVAELENHWRNAQCWLELARFIAQKESGA